MKIYIVIPPNKVAEIEAIERHNNKMQCIKTIDGRHVVPIANEALFSDVLATFERVQLDEQTNFEQGNTPIV
jgi:hypothetical protein